MSADEKATFGGADPHVSVTLRIKEMDLESGMLGKVFGNQSNAPTNIAGFVAVCLVFAGVLMVAFVGWERSAEFWKVIVPMLSLVLGFLFGKNS